MQLPIDPKYNTTTFYSISQYVSQMLNDLNTLDTVSPLKWNLTLRYNSDVIDNYTSYLTHVPSF